MDNVFYGFNLVSTDSVWTGSTVYERYERERRDWRSRRRDDPRRRANRVRLLAARGVDGLHLSVFRGASGAVADPATGDARQPPARLPPHRRAACQVRVQDKWIMIVMGLESPEHGLGINMGKNPNYP